MHTINPNIDLKILDEIIEASTLELRKRQTQVLEVLESITGKSENIDRLHGFIGSYNQVFAKVHTRRFSNFEHFQRVWLDELIKSNWYDYLKKLLKIKISQDYIFIFLERTFYRKLKERTRLKPSETLWSVWFGDNKNCYGLFISPTYFNNIWSNKAHQIRKVKFNYWTIEHVLSTGLIDSKANRLINFKNIHQLLEFYKKNFHDLSVSPYEKRIYELYQEYINSSTAPLKEPFLIPEFRYRGLDILHEHRLDFTCLNSYTDKLIGFELSPQSTHIRITSNDTKDEELKQQWEKEIDKRNDYFSNFGITTITFADKQLSNIENCFDTIKGYLSARNEELEDIDTMINKINH